MESMKNCYVVVCTALCSISLLFVFLLGIMTIIEGSIFETSNYKIVQFPDDDQLVTHIWGDRFGDSEIVYSKYDDFDVNNIDSLSQKRREQAEKLVESFNDD